MTHQMIQQYMDVPPKDSTVYECPSKRINTIWMSLQKIHIDVLPKDPTVSGCPFKRFNSL